MKSLIKYRQFSKVYSLFLFLISFSFFVIIALKLGGTATLNCSFVSAGSCASPNISVLYAQNDSGGYENAHAQNTTNPYYLNSLCCSSDASISDSCGTTFLKLSNKTNAHVQVGNYSWGTVYPVSACISLSGGNVTCSYASTNCNPGYSCIASIASSNSSANNLTDAHIGSCNKYNNKICCIAAAPPNSPSVFINSSDGSNRTAQDLNCYSTITDPDSGSKLNVTVNWFKNKVLALSIDYNSSYANGTAFVSVLNNGNTTRGENWSCGLRLFDGSAYSPWANSSTNITIANTPPNVNLLSPPNADTTITRAPNFTWSSTDDDGDTLTYTINITAKPTGSDDNRFVSGISTANYTPSSRLKYLFDNGYYYQWSVKAFDGIENGSWGSFWLVNISSYVSISTPTSLVEFGTLDLFSPNDTTDDSPLPFRVRNDGNCLSNISVSATDLWKVTPNPTSNYKFKVRNESASENVFNWASSLTSWTQMPALTGGVIGIAGLNDSDLNDIAKVDLYVQVPTVEPSGNKNSTVQFVASLGE